MSVRLSRGATATVSFSTPQEIIISSADDSISSVNVNKFSRIKQKDFYDTEQVRYDIPVILANAFIYTGLALKTTAVSTALWNIVRTKFDANSNPSQEQHLANIKWDDRVTAAWP